MKKLLVCTVCLGLACAACNSPSPRINAPPHGTPEIISDLQGTLVYMADNALLEDMCISDMHFFPHRALLSPLGEERLSRLVSLIDAYGGEIRFSTNLEDEDLVAERLSTIIKFLLEAGIDTSTEVVRLDLPGGTGMDASEVILIKANEGTYQPGGSDDGLSGLSEGSGD